MRPLLALALLASAAVAAPPAGVPRFALSEYWDAAFRQAEMGDSPAGVTRGTVLYADGHFPRVRAMLEGAGWKGKTFYGDGNYTNRWVGGIEAVPNVVTTGASWIDGRPTMVMQYPPSALILGGEHSEVRQIAPGVWLGARDLNPATGRPKSWILLQSR